MRSPRSTRTSALSLVAAGALTASVLVGGGGTPAVAAASPDLSITNVTAHLQQLQSIATANGGNRATGRPGYKASLDWVKAKLDAAGYTTQVQSFSTSSGTSYNLVADWPGGDPEHVVMTGAHLDSVSAGPGINDNGTGSAAVLEAALAWASSGNTSRNHLRFAWWGAEEQGLLGSNHYMRNLPTADKDRIDLYMNYDMVGSPNPGYFVYDDNAVGNFARDAMTAYYTSKGIPWEYIDVQGRSDHASFRSYGIATTGMYSGGETTNGGFVAMRSNRSPAAGSKRLPSRTSRSTPLIAAVSRVRSVARRLTSVATTSVAWVARCRACTPQPVPRSSARPTGGRTVSWASEDEASLMPSTYEGSRGFSRPSRPGVRSHTTHQSWNSSP